MEDLGIGTKCSFSLCNLQDFLPAQCPHCKSIYCGEHILPEKHLCDGPDLTNRPVWIKRRICGFKACGKPSLQSAITDNEAVAKQALCPQCQGAFCAEHRHAASHDCIPLQTVSSDGKAVARALLAKNFPVASRRTTTPTPRTVKPPSDPAKLAKFNAIEHMKMRHRAVPGDPKDKNSSLAVAERLYVRVCVQSDLSYERVFWFRKGVSVGRALDLLAAQMNVQTSSSPLSLCKLTGSDLDFEGLSTDKLLDDQVQDFSQIVISMNGGGRP